MGNIIINVPSSLNVEVLIELTPVPGSGIDSTCHFTAKDFHLVQKLSHGSYVTYKTPYLGEYSVSVEESMEEVWSLVSKAEEEEKKVIGDYKIIHLENIPSNLDLLQERKFAIQKIKEIVFDLNLKYIDAIFNTHPDVVEDTRETAREIMDEIILRCQDYNSLKNDFSKRWNLNYNDYFVEQ